MDKQSFIYGLQDPRDGLIYYVGKTDNPMRRMSQHIAGREINEQKSSWLNSLLEDGLRPELVILEKVTRTDWERKEIYWIDHGHKNGWPLTNIQSGGRFGYLSAILDYEFMRSFVPPVLWSFFDVLSLEEKDAMCLCLALAMMEVRQYARHDNQRARWYTNADWDRVNDMLIYLGQELAKNYLAPKVTRK
jgi:hypothetical protein